MEAVLPLEILSESLRVMNFHTNSKKDMLDEKCQAAQLQQAAYKAHMENFYSKRVWIKNIKIREWVLRNNKVSHSETQGMMRAT